MVLLSDPRFVTFDLALVVASLVALLVFRYVIAVLRGVRNNHFSNCVAFTLTLASTHSLLAFLQQAAGRCLFANTI